MPHYNGNLIFSCVDDEGAIDLVDEAASRVRMVAHAAVSPAAASLASASSRPIGEPVRFEATEYN